MAAHTDNQGRQAGTMMLDILRLLGQQMPMEDRGLAPCIRTLQNGQLYLNRSQLQQGVAIVPPGPHPLR